MGNVASERLNSNCCWKIPPSFTRFSDITPYGAEREDYFEYYWSFSESTYLPVALERDIQNYFDIIPLLFSSQHSYV